MDRQTAKNIVANIGVIQAYAEGKTIEFFSFGKWNEIFQPNFDSPATHYRVKPAKFIVCPECEGHGTIMNISMGGHAYT